MFYIYQGISNYGNYEQFVPQLFIERSVTMGTAILAYYKIILPHEQWAYTSLSVPQCSLAFDCEVEGMTPTGSGTAVPSHSLLLSRYLAVEWRV